MRVQPSPQKASSIVFVHAIFFPAKQTDTLSGTVKVCKRKIIGASVEPTHGPFSIMLLGDF